MRRFARKLQSLWRRRQLDCDLADELNFHLETQARESGGPGQARRRLGNPAAIHETCRELWTFAALETWWQDIRYALRTLVRNPTFALVATAALALGIGADTAVFTIVESVFSWDLGLDHVDRIVTVSLNDASHRQQFGVSYPDFRELRNPVRSLAGLAAYQFVPVNVSDGSGLPERYHCVYMSANGFTVAEYQPALGRDFGAEDERPGAPAVVMLAHHVWQDRYGKDPKIVGRTVRVNEVPMTIVGVMPPGRRFPEDTDLWTPLIPDVRQGGRDDRRLMLFGRLAAGVSPARARAEVQTIAHALAARHPEAGQGMRANLRPIQEITGAYGTRPIFAALWGAVGFVLLIACADVANMLLARGEGRAREISIRAAIGAGRGRIVRQLLVESVVLSAAGGLLGWGVAIGGLRWFEAATSSLRKPIWLNLSMNRHAFLYLAAISIATGILFGLAPALRLARTDIHAAVKEGGRGAAGSRRGHYLSRLLVTVETALCLILLAGAGLMIRSLINLYGTSLGLDAAGVLTMRVNLPPAKYPRAQDQVSFHEALKPRLEALPGVEVSAVASNLPLTGWIEFPYELEGAVTERGRAPRIGALVVGADYFRLLRVHPRRGRLFTAADGVSGEPAVIVNESFAAKFWPGEDATGKRLRLLRDGAARPWLTVAGVTPDILQNSRNSQQHDPLIYLPYAAEPQRVMTILARTRVPPATLAGPFRGAVQALDENLPVYEVRTLEDRIAETRLPVKLIGGMLSVFAAMALVLAGLGLYAVIAHAVSRRTQEIGVRMAMGATNRDISRMVFAQGIKTLTPGLALGLPAAFAVTRVLRTTLVGVSADDPATFAVVVVVLVASAALGCAIPARRAVRVDPAVSLRCE